MEPAKGQRGQSIDGEGDVTEGGVAMERELAGEGGAPQRHPRKWLAGGAVLSVASALALASFLTGPAAARHERQRSSGSPTASTDTLPAWEVSCLEGHQFSLSNSGMTVLAPGSATASALTRAAEQDWTLLGRFPMAPPALVQVQLAPPGMLSYLSGQTVGVVGAYDMGMRAPLSFPAGTSAAQAAKVVMNGWIAVLHNGVAVAGLGCMNAP